jgi:hypothetical protein
MADPDVARIQEHRHAYNRAIQERNLATIAGFYYRIT